MNRKAYRFLPLLLAVLLLMGVLSACGGSRDASAGAQSAASEAPVASEADADRSSEEAPAPAEEPAAESALEPEGSPEEEIPEDPEALGRWLWEKNQAMSAELFAMDADLQATSTMIMDGEEISVPVNMRMRVIYEDEAPKTVQMDMDTQGQMERTWYEDGMVYRSSELGNFKAPMSAEDFNTQYVESQLKDYSELGADAFGTLTGEKTDKGYQITFGDISLEAMLSFTNLTEELLGSMDMGDLAQIKSVTMEGTILLGEDFHMTRSDLTMEYVMDVMGQEISGSSSTIETVNSINDGVTILVPSDDSSYRTLDDINIPDLFETGYELLSLQDALGYQESLTAEIRGGLSEGTYTALDDINYIMSYDGITMRWDSGLYVGDTLMDWTSDRCEGAQGQYITPNGTEEYTDDGVSNYMSIVEYLAVYTETFDEGDNFTTDTRDGNLVLRFDLGEDNAEAILQSNLDYLTTGVDLSQADSLSCTGTMELVYDVSGLLRSQTLSLSATAVIAGQTVEIDMTDLGSVTATGDGVTVDLTGV